MNIKLEIADTPELLAKGLMHRTDIPENSGMLFKFPSLTEASFWGKNTYIPLDIAFVDHNNVIIDIKKITPMSTRMVRSVGLCDKAIEVNAGFFEKHNIGVGHKIQFKVSGGKEMEAFFDASHS